MGIKFDLSDVVNVLLALMIFEVLKKLFVNGAMSYVPEVLKEKDASAEYEVESYEAFNALIDDNIVVMRFESAIALKSFGLYPNQLNS